MPKASVSNKDENYDLSKLRFDFDLSKCDFLMDRLQEKLLERYLRYDINFRRAFTTDYTNDFFGFFKDKVKLGEPIHLSVMGQVRGGKSEAMITLCIFHQACYGRYFSIKYISANVYEFIEKLQTMPQDELTNTIHLIDEEKTAVFGIGSTAKKMKVTDVQNIIAVKNISSIMINPISWANSDAFYGLRAFGRDFKSMTTRFMLYNLTANKSSEKPIGLVYIPSFQVFLPKENAKALKKSYDEKKDKWTTKEQRGEGDVLKEMKIKYAKLMFNDKEFKKLKTKDEKVTYISIKLGSEFTKGEVEEVFFITKLLEKGITV